MSRWWGRLALVFIAAVLVAMWFAVISVSVPLLSFRPGMAEYVMVGILVAQVVSATWLFVYVGVKGF